MPDRVGAGQVDPHKIGGGFVSARTLKKHRIVRHPEIAGPGITGARSLFK